MNVMKGIHLIHGLFGFVPVNDGDETGNHRCEIDPLTPPKGWVFALHFYKRSTATDMLVDDVGDPLS